MSVGAGSIKRAAAKKTVTEKKVSPETKPEVRKKNVTVKQEIPNTCHITEELPVYLL